MPIRIYALAKELKLDSKDLVDVCNKAGVTGKGSALASLSDEEIDKVKAYLSGGTKTRGKALAGVSATADTAATAARAITRDDYIAPAATPGKPKVLDAIKAKRDDADVESEKPEPPKPSAKREPIIKLAAIPQAEQPAERPAESAEPAPQKPIMTLSKDAIRGVKEGSTAPLEQFTRQHDRKRRKPDAPVASGKKPPFPPAGEEKPAERAIRGRRRKDEGGRTEKDEEAPPQGQQGKTGLAGMSSSRYARQQNRKRRSTRPEDGTGRRRRETRLTRKGTNTAAPRKGSVVVELPCTVRSFSEATGIPAVSILRSLMSLGTTVANINVELDPELAEMLAEESELALEFREHATLEDTVISEIESFADDPSELVPRPPIVTFLGHVDHGKTSLLDRIIGIDVVSGEAGGITQHIRAYHVDKDNRIVSFVDTPGHEAFTEMRARGANVTDIAVLVVAADDGVMPQTEEAISHARAAGVPIVVALNKIDLVGVDINRVLQDLSAHDLLPVEWGGDIEVVKTSATTGEGIDDLLETLLLTAELKEYKANPDRPAVGTCLEAKQEGGRGVVAKVIVQHGTLRVGDILVCGGSHGRLKAMYDSLRPHVRVDEAGPSIPVNITGLDSAPEAGDRFYVLSDIAQARDIAAQRQDRARTQSLAGFSTRISFEEFQRRLEEGVLGEDEETVTLNLIIRADVRGSIEAIQKELAKFDNPEVQIKVLQASVGGITVADVTLADASEAVIAGFNVIPDENARSLADERGVEIRRYEIIYKLTEDIKSMLEGKLKPEEHIRELGRALVQQTFSISRLGTVAGCRVLAGTIERGCRVRVNRDGRGIGEYPLDSLRREKDDTKEVREGYECGMKLAGFNDLKEGDILEAFKIEEVARTL